MVTTEPEAASRPDPARGGGRGPAGTPGGRLPRPWGALAVLLAVVPIATHAVDLLLTDRRWWPQVFEDDAYYYLGVARSLADGDGSTFTGLLETNGYHPLWLLVLVPISAVARTPPQVVAALVVVQSVLWIGVVREALRIGRLVGSAATAVAGVSVLGVLAVVTGRLSFNGMESAPLLLFLLLAVRIGMEAGDDDPGADRRFGLLLALVCLTRLDAVLTAVPLGLLMLGRGSPERSVLGRRAARLAAPTCVALGAYAVVNLAVFGSATPVSGRAKGVGGPFWNLEPARQLLQAGDALGRPLWFGAGALLMMTGAWLCGQWRASRQGNRLMTFTLAFGTGQLLLLAYLVVGTSYRVWPWYHYNVALLAFGSALVLGEWVRRRLGVPAWHTVALTAVGLILGVQAVAVLHEDPVYPQSVTAAAFVDENLPSDAVLAMGDRAGIFGYLAERPLLHLEGLMADAAYIEAMGDGTALDRMIEEGVDYYVTYGPRGRPAVIGGRSCWRFPEPYQGEGPKFDVTVCDDDIVFRDGDGADELTIWRFRPGLSRGGSG